MAPLMRGEVEGTLIGVSSQILFSGNCEPHLQALAPSSHVSLPVWSLTKGLPSDPHRTIQILLKVLGCV